jgi:hypothetical protein
VGISGDENTPMLVISGLTVATYEMYGGTVVVVGAGRVVVVVAAVIGGGAIVVAGCLTRADGDPPPPHALSTAANTTSQNTDRRASCIAIERIPEPVPACHEREVRRGTARRGHVAVTGRADALVVVAT